jgi:serine/threonine-protein kinase RsbW/sigma-B regulation protein RsbU (phosphoserine phosphatase)
MPDRVSLEVSSDPRLLGLIRGVTQAWLELIDLASDRRREVVLAVDEACSNAMRHAYEGRTDGSVELLLAECDDSIEITVRDQGKPCPAELTQYRPLMEPDSHAMTPGGLGVKLIHTIFDEVRFCPGTTSGNCVTMRLYRTHDARGSQ